MQDDSKNIYPNPWDFSNSDKTLQCPDNQNKIVYDDLSEIAMGGPLVGKAFWVDKDNKIHVLNDKCGGPPIWDKQGQRCSIPVWTKTMLSGSVQQIAMLDTISKLFTIYKTTFHVLDFRSFDNNFISGYDSPIHNPRQFNFDIDTEETLDIWTIK